MVEFCISSWCRMVVTTRRLHKIPKNERPISSNTQYTTFKLIGLISSNSDKEEEKAEEEKLVIVPYSVGIVRYIQLIMLDQLAVELRDLLSISWDILINYSGYGSII